MKTVIYVEKYYRIRVRRGEYLEATAKLYSFHGQVPYFSVTGSHIKDFEPGASGCIHDIIRENIPELAPVIDLHLNNIDGVPTHYVEDVKYWIESGELQHVADTIPGFDLAKAEKLRRLVFKWAEWVLEFDDEEIRKERGEYARKMFETYLRWHLPIFNEMAHKAAEVLGISAARLAEIRDEYSEKGKL